MSRVSSKNFLVPDLEAERTVFGRIDQFRRELAVQLRRDVTTERLAELIDRAGPSFAQWKKGTARPTKESLERLERLAQAVGLHRYSMRYFDYGEGNQVSKSPPVRLRKAGEAVGREAKRG